MVGASTLLPRGLSGGARAAAHRPRLPLGFRRQAADGRDRRLPRARRGGPDGLPQALGSSLSDPSAAARLRLPGQRRRLHGRRQHLRLQLPFRRRHLALVDARLRRGDRRQPGREPVRAGRPRLAAGRSRVRRPQQRSEGHGARERRPRAGVRSGGLEVGRRASATTSTSRRRVASRAASRTGPRRRTGRSRRGGSRSRGSRWRRAARPRR